MYVLQYTYVDTSGNTGTATRTVIVNSAPGGSTYTPSATPTPTPNNGSNTPNEPIDMDDIINPSIDPNTCFSPLDKSTIDQ